MHVQHFADACHMPHAMCTQAHHERADSLQLAHVALAVAQHCANPGAPQPLESALGQHTLRALTGHQGSSLVCFLRRVITVQTYTRRPKRPVRQQQDQASTSFM